MKPHSGSDAAFSIRISLLYCLILFLARPVQSAVLSIDLGSEWMKVAVVDLKPGQSPISIATNEMSKRKSPALVALSSGNRLVGEEAAGIIARYPERVYSRVRDIVGKSFHEVKQLLDSQYLSYDILEDERGAASVRIDNGQSFSLEELLGMLLSYAKGLGEAHAKSLIKDAVITVPPYLGQTERECILDAAELGGLNVLALVNEYSGAALQYGINKDFSNESKHVLFYDLGANSAYAALVYYSAYNTKEYGKAVTVNQFQVKDVRWDSSLGGNKMELRLVEYFADLFNDQMGGGIDVRQFPKAVAKLKKQVKRTKEILSANTEAVFSVEALYNDRDFRSIITRKKFEELCGDIWQQALSPIKQVLEHSGLAVEQLHAVEIIGGSTRIPKLQMVLSEFLGKESLDRHLDADEAIVLGAALHAANISDGFKMNRKLGMIDGVSYGIVMKIENLKSGSANQQEIDEEIVVPRLKKLPSKVFKSVKNSEDFKVSLLYDSAGLLPVGISSCEIVTFGISGVTEAHSKYASQNLSSPIKTNLHFSLSRSGLLALNRAETVVEISEWVEVPVKLPVNNSHSLNETKQSLENSGNRSETEEGNELSDSKDKENTAVIAENGNGTVPNEPQQLKPMMERKLRKRTIRLPLKITVATVGNVRPMSKEALLEARLRLERMNHQEEEKRKTAEAKNNLESYIYVSKEKLDYAEDIEKISTAEQRDLFRQELAAAEDWLYGDGEEATGAEFRKRLESLKEVGEPIFFRLAELVSRPVAVDLAEKYIESIKSTVEEWQKRKPWIDESSRNEVLEAAVALQKWLSEKQHEQQKISGHEEPVFTSEHTYMKAAKLQEKVTKLSNTPRPKPQVEKKSSSNLNDSSASNSDSHASEASKSSNKKADSQEPNITNEATDTMHDEL